MRRIAEWIWSNPWPKPYVLSTSTNGTLFTSESKAWFRRNADRFLVGLSLDGTPEMQRTNRGCSFQDIDLDFFLATWPEQKVKMTVSCETLSSLAEGIIHLQERGFKVHANLGYGIPWNDSQIEVFSRQLRILGEYYLGHPQVPPVSLLDLKIASVLNENHPVKKYCGTGTHMQIYDVDGTVYPCHLFTPLVLSCAKAELARKLDFDHNEHLVDPKCWGCCGKDLCPTCYGFNYKLQRRSCDSRSGALPDVPGTIAGELPFPGLARAAEGGQTEPGGLPAGEGRAKDSSELDRLTPGATGFASAVG